jgi:hypothetical protein
MACELTTGISFECNDKIGGIKALYIQQLSDFETGVTLDNATKKVDGLPEATLFKYTAISKLTNNFEETITNEQNGSLTYTQTVNVQLKKLSQAKQLELDRLAKNRVVVFVQDRNDAIWMVGRQYGAWLSARSGATGTEMGDFNGYTLALTAEEPAPAPELEAFTAVPFDNFADITVSTTVINN